MTAFRPTLGSSIGKLADALRRDSVGAALLVAMTACALVWANSPWAETYMTLRDLPVGYAPWGWELTLGEWASDGLLAVFFFVVGLELKREFVTGDLRSVRTAIAPVVAAVGGVVVPAFSYLAIIGPDAALRQGWAIPTATDIAFAVAILALVGPNLPGALRLFLLTLAVVDDMIAVGIIALCYSQNIRFAPLCLAVVTVCCFGALTRGYRRLFIRSRAAAWLLLLPIAVVAWAFMLASGIHATIAGVLLGLSVPVLAPGRRSTREPGVAETLEHRCRPLATGIALPIFAFFAGGVAVTASGGAPSASADRLSLAIVIALAVGKPVGILLATWAVTRLTRARLHPQIRWGDLTGIAMLGGIGFTVSLLVAGLAFEPGGAEADRAKLAVFIGSGLSMLAGSVVLSLGDRRHRGRSRHPDAR